MPRRHEVASLRHSAILAVGRSFEIVCYGLQSRADLLETMAYLDTATPLAPLPASLLEDMYSVICRYNLPCIVIRTMTFCVRKRCSAHYLHALVQPQIRGMEVQAGTIHHALSLLQQRCPSLQTFSLTGSTSMNPELFIPVFKHFPNLTKIDLSGNIMDDRAFDSIGQVCHR